MRLRYRIGLYLLRPALLDELQIAKGYHEQQGQGPLERYWMGRVTSLTRIILGGFADA